MRNLIFVLIFLGITQLCQAQSNPIIEGITGWKPATGVSKYESAIKAGCFLGLAIWGFEQNTNYGCVTGFYFTYKFGINTAKYSLNLK